MSGARDLFDVSGDDVLLRVHVQPGAGTTKVAGHHGDALKVRVAAPPVSGRANDATIRLLADELGIAPGDIELSTGATSRLKRFRLKGIDADTMEQILTRILREPSQHPRLL